MSSSAAAGSEHRPALVVRLGPPELSWGEERYPGSSSTRAPRHLVEPGEFLLRVRVSPIGIDDCLPGPPPVVPIDKGFQTESDRIGTGRGHSLADEGVNVGEQSLVDSRHEPWQAISMAMNPGTHRAGACAAHRPGGQAVAEV